MLKIRVFRTVAQDTQNCMFLVVLSIIFKPCATAVNDFLGPVSCYDQMFRPCGRELFRVLTF